MAGAVFRHGGDRITGRVSHGLTAGEVDSIWRAGRAALAIGLPLNRLVTVHWEALGLDDLAAGRGTQTLVTLAHDWLRDRGVRFASVWVRENDAGDGSKGSHVHWLLHVPESHRRAFLGALRRFASRVTGGGRLVRRSIQSRRVGWQESDHRGQDGYRLNLAVVLAYVTKQSQQHARANIASHAQRLYLDFDLSRLPEPHAGRIMGKRAGVSRLLASRWPLPSLLWSPQLAHFGFGL